MIYIGTQLDLIRMNIQPKSSSSYINEEYRKKLNNSYKPHLNSLKVPTEPISREVLLLTQIPTHSQICIQTHAIHSIAKILELQEELGVPQGYIPLSIQKELQKKKRRGSISHSLSSGDVDIGISFGKVPSNPQQPFKHIDENNPPIKYSKEEQDLWLTPPKHGFAERFESKLMDNVSLKEGLESLTRMERILKIS